MEEFFFTPTNNKSKDDGWTDFGEDETFSETFAKKEKKDEDGIKKKKGKGLNMDSLMSFFDSETSSNTNKGKTQNDSSIGSTVVQVGFSTQSQKRVKPNTNQSGSALFDFFTPAIQEKNGEKKKEPTIQTKEEKNLNFGDFGDGQNDLTKDITPPKASKNEQKIGKESEKTSKDDSIEKGKEKDFGSFNEGENDDIFDYADPKNIKEEEAKDIISSITQPPLPEIEKIEEKNNLDNSEDTKPRLEGEKSVSQPTTNDGEEVKKEDKKKKSRKMMMKKKKKEDFSTPPKKKKWSILKMFDQFPSPTKKKDNVQTYNNTKQESEKGEVKEGNDQKAKGLGVPGSQIGDDAIRTPEIDMDTLLFTQSPTFPDDHQEDGELEEWEKLLIEASGLEVKNKEDMEDKAPLCLFLYEIFLVYVKALDVFRWIEDEPDLRTCRKFIETRKMRVFMRGLIDLDLIVQFALRRLPSKERNQLSLFVDHFRGVLKRMLHGGDGYFKKEVASGELKLKTAVMGVIFKNSCQMTGKQSVNVCKWGDVILDVKVANFWKTFCSKKPPKLRK